jgi:hypothetical protein
MNRASAVPQGNQLRWPSAKSIRMQATAAELAGW